MENGDRKKRRRRRFVYWILGAGVGINGLYRIAKLMWAQSQKVKPQEVPFSSFLDHVKNGLVARVLMGTDAFEVFPKKATGSSLYKTRVPPYMDPKDLIQLLQTQQVEFSSPAPHFLRHSGNVLLAAVPFVYLALMWKLVRDAQNPQDSVGKDHQLTGERVGFADVAGADAAVAELAEVVDFIRHPARYRRLGARLPKGVLLSGPSGTGKTLLARAVAGEAGVPCFVASASDFVEMLVGRGAARVRDLFRRGLAAAPCLIFIDEIDALAKARGGLNSHDEREQTLNQLLTEMDGFERSAGGKGGGGGDGVVVLAATNRPEVLDPALVRPGRFDRHVRVGPPDAAGAAAVLRVHLRRVKHTVTPGELEALARAAAAGGGGPEGRGGGGGATGADLACCVNDAALLAVRRGEAAVTGARLAEALRRNRAQRRLLRRPGGGGGGGEQAAAAAAVRGLFEGGPFFAALGGGGGGGGGGEGDEGGGSGEEDEDDEEQGAGGEEEGASSLLAGAGHRRASVGVNV